MLLRLTSSVVGDHVPGQKWWPGPGVGFCIGCRAFERGVSLHLKKTIKILKKLRGAGLMVRVSLSSAETRGYPKG